MEHQSVGDSSYSSIQSRSTGCQPYGLMSSGAIAARTAKIMKESDAAEIVEDLLSSDAGQGSVAGHTLASGLLGASQLSVEHVTVPLVPEPAAVPHVVAQSVALAAVQVPGHG